jgi:uncharacterized protein YukJ
MPLGNYGILKGWVIRRKLGFGSRPHFQIHIVDNKVDYRVAVNVESQKYPSELKYLIDDNFSHPILETIETLDPGFHKVKRRPGSMAIDYIRGNFFDPEKMKTLPHNVPGPDNDLNEKIDAIISNAIGEEDAMVYAFGEHWGPETGKRDKHFGFLPVNGLHDIHMNQGNVDSFADSDGVWQDGALLINFPDNEQWVGIFLAFQSQSWHTDDQTGHRLDEPTSEQPSPPRAQKGAVRIIAALANPEGKAPEDETVTLINTAPYKIDLTGWKIADKMKNKFTLQGNLKPGDTKLIHLPQDVQLSNKGGIITLLDAEGLKVDGVSYSKKEAHHEGWTIIFN